MKKITSRKGGFTLTEIILVIAIIVLLSSAAFVGVAVTLNRADKMQYDLSVNNGNNFESNAWVTVKNLTYGEGGYITQATYEPETPTDPSDPSASNSQSLSPQEVVEYDAVANQEIQEILNSGVSRKDIWVVRDDNGNITDWKWYYVGDPELSGDLSDETKASIASHRITSRPVSTVYATNGNNNNNNNNNNNQQYENYDNNNNNNNNNNTPTGTPSTYGSYTAYVGAGQATGVSVAHYNTQPGQETGALCCTFNGTYLGQDLNVITIKAPSGLTFNSNDYSVVYNADNGTYTITKKSGYFDPYSTRLDYSGVVNDGQFEVLDIGHA